MASPDQLAHAKELERHASELKQAYRDLIETFAGKDLLKHLEDSYASSHHTAGAEMENMDKKALYLQDAHAYGKVLAYIKDKAS